MMIRGKGSHHLCMFTVLALRYWKVSLHVLLTTRPPIPSLQHTTQVLMQVGFVRTNEEPFLLIIFDNRYQYNYLGWAHHQGIDVSPRFSPATLEVTDQGSSLIVAPRMKNGAIFKNQILKEMLPGLSCRLYLDFKQLVSSGSYLFGDSPQHNYCDL